MPRSMNEPDPDPFIEIVANPLKFAEASARFYLSIFIPFSLPDSTILAFAG
jgi:hypothetical protein